MADADQTNLTVLTVELLSAYVSKNSVADGDLAGLIQSTHAALKVIHTPTADEPPAPEHVPAVSVRKSLGSRTHILSMIDGKPYQTLKRHLSKHGLTPAEYRERYGLAKDYPMVAPAYSEQRRGIAQRLGLGQRGKGASSAAATPEALPAEASAPAPVAATPARASRKAVAASAPEPTKETASAMPTAKPLRAASKPTTKASAIESAPAPVAEPEVKKTSARKTAAKSATGAAKASPTRKSRATPDAMPTPEAPASRTARSSRSRKSAAPVTAES